MIPYIEDFIFYKELNCSPASLSSYRGALQKLEGFTDHLYPEILPDFVRWLRKQPISNVSVRTYVRSVKVFLRYVETFSFVNFSFNYDVTLPRSDAEFVEPLTNAEVEFIDSFFSDYCNRNYLCVHLMLDCGLRLGEVLALTPENFNFDSGYIRIQQTKSRAPRVVPIPPFLALNLMAYMVTAFPGKPVFDISSSGFKTMMYRLKKSTGIERLHAHLFRHTFGTSYIFHRMGDLERLRLLMGHSDITTTCMYIHLAGSYDIVRADVYKIDDIYRR